MEFISTSDPYLWSAVSVEAAMEEVSPAKKICLSPAQIPDSTTTEIQDLNNSILFILANDSEHETLESDEFKPEIVESLESDESDINSSVAMVSQKPMQPNIRGHLLDHPKMIKKGKKIPRYFHLFLVLSYLHS